MFEKKFLLGIGLTDEKEESILEYIVKSAKKSIEKYYIVTPNPEILVFAQKHKDFKTILNEAKIALIDGVGIIWAYKVLGKDIGYRVSGTDFMEKLCKAVSDYNLASKEKPITVGFLGAKPGVAELTAERLSQKYIGLKVAFAGDEWISDVKSLSHVANDARRTKSKNLKLAPSSLSESRSPKGNLGSNNKTGSAFSSFASGQASDIDILFVAFGFPKQEMWMAENLNKIPVKVAMGVGGAFDYISGNVPRAPVFVRNLGFEWLYRLIRQPWRWKRQLALIEFGYLVLKEKLSNS